MMEKYDMTILSNIFIFGFQKNLTFHSLYDPDFQGFLFCLNKEFELPAETTLMRYIKQFAKYIESRIFFLFFFLKIFVY